MSTTLASIVAAGQGLKLALGVGKDIILADSALDQALLKMELNGMMDTLVEVKQHLRSLGDEIEEKDDRIKELELRLTDTGKTRAFMSARYHVKENGDPTGKAFCQICWVDENRLIPLVMETKGYGSPHYCGICRNKVDGQYSPLEVDTYIKNQREAATRLKTEYKVITHP